MHVKLIPRVSFLCLTTVMCYTVCVRVCDILTDGESERIAVCRSLISY